VKAENIKVTINGVPYDGEILIEDDCIFNDDHTTLAGFHVWYPNDNDAIAINKLDPNVVSIFKGIEYETTFGSRADLCSEELMLDDGATVKCNERAGHLAKGIHHSSGYTCSWGTFEIGTRTHFIQPKDSQYNPYREYM
jgi:hypothetical protein